MRATALFCAAVVISWANAAVAQTYMDADGQGYTIRVGNMVQHYRDGVSQTYNRFGNVETYSDSTGTYGNTFYGPAGANYSYSNATTGRYNSGYYPYQNQYGYQSESSGSNNFQNSYSPRYRRW